MESFATQQAKRSPGAPARRTCARCAGAVPATRWSLAGHADKLSDAQASAAQHGAFVSGADRFDNRAFSIAPAEARTMDPQQRTLLETGYVALHGSGLRSDWLLGGAVGIERPGWARAQPPLARGSVCAETSNNVSSKSARFRSNRRMSRAPHITAMIEFT